MLRAKLGLYLSILAVPTGAGVDETNASSSKLNPKSNQTVEEEMSVTDDGLELENAVVIEGRVEKPQVQFTLLREAPPFREIIFEESFLPEILKLKCQNVPDPIDGNH